MIDAQGLLANPLTVLSVLIVVLGSTLWVIRWLFRQALESERRRADDWKHVADTYRTSVEVLLQRLDATTVVAETANKVLSSLPPVDKGLQP